ncbi:T9SS type A sorting domain-containing protein [Hymenobacter sp. M29]|uniref:T9SS type A sorting domain-containing protein n=1 Tax=Hymenobacter mellowenesis TaxID=3063995 RepID=A0ABT9AG11_9BACT|nr:T9SS type A sorting domain-containing protein [Hymenobacter sp. M29]MDO7848805.1 T9SS type A sorting domain-containing protein [Hymenobacter sp. M29]
MHTPFLSNRLGRWLAVTLLALMSATTARAQLTGTKAIPGDYATVAAAITALNAGGVGAGGVTFNVAAGYTETFASPTAGAITATGTSANPIVFQKAGTGANPVLTAGATGTGTQDAIISLVGSDYVTFANIDVAENSANTTTATQMEFGYALFRASATDGCQNVNISGATITLNKTNTSTIGIWGANSLATATTAVTATSAAGANSGIKLNGNTVANAFLGIYLAGNTSTAANADTGNEIGTTAGNTLTGLGGSNTSVYGVRAEFQQNLKVENNTIAIPAGNTSSTVYGIGLGTGTATGIVGTVLLNNNTVSITTATTSTVIGILQNGSSAVTTSTITNNKVQNSALTGASGAVYYIQDAATTASTAINITGNQVLNNSAATSGNVIGIYKTGTATALTASSNTITGNTKSGVGSTSTSAPVGLHGFYTTASITTLTLTNNTISNNVASNTGVGVLNGIYNNPSGTNTTLTATGNTVSNNQVQGSSGALYSMHLGYSGTIGTFAASNNVITNNTIPNTSGSTASVVYGIYNFATLSTAESNTGNTVTGLAIGGANTSTGNIVTGIYSYTSDFPKTVSRNTVGNLTSSGSGTVTGIYYNTGNQTFTLNKIYDLSAGGSGGVVYGANLLGSTTNNVANNLIGNLSAPASTSLLAVTGLNIGSGTTVNVYYNTLYLNTSSTGATFGTSGIYLGSTTSTLDARNNIVVNTSTAAGTGGYTAVLRRISGTAGTVPANYATTSNNNLFFAGTPSATNLIYVEGTTTATNAQQTLAAYKAFMVNRDQQAVTENPPFASTTGSAANFLHIATGTPTQVESGGTPISITTDYDGETRNASTPDIGADEGSFTLQDLTGPSITFTPLTNSSSTGNRTLTATITDPSGISTSAPPRIFFRKGTSGAFTSALATSTSGSSYTFTISAAALGGLAANDVVQYYVVAQDVPGNVSSNPAGGTFSTNPASVYAYTVLSTLNGVYYVGTSTSPDPTRTYATLTAAANAYNGSGLAGAVTFLLLDNAYSATTGETFPVIFFNNPEASATNSLLIKPNTGANPVITAAGSVLALASTRYVTIDGSNTANGTTRNLTLSNTTLTANTYGVGLLTQTGQAQANLFATVRNVNVLGGGTTANATTGIALGGADNDNVTLQNNSIQGVTTGIQAFGSANTSVGGLDNLVITGNVIGAATAAAATNINQYGIVVASALSPVVSRNEVQNIVNPTTTFSSNMTGIVLQDVQTAVVTRNTVHNLSYTGTSTAKLYGISSLTSTSTFNTAANASANRFDNNLVYALNSTATSGSWNTSGINNNGGYGDQYYYNTVYLSGQLSNGAAGSAAFSNGNGISSTAATNIDVRNNIFSIIGGTGLAATPLYAHYTTLTTYTGSTLNYNDLYVTVGATGVARIGRLNAVDATTLADWRTATGQEANSVSVDPQFVQTTTAPYNLTPAAAALNGVATPITSVTVDYTGATRGTTPDIGAYEFTPPACQAVSNLAFASITPTTANVTFTAPASGANSYTVTYTPAGGTAATVTPNPTGSPVALTGLTPSTTYTVTVTTNCTGATSPSATGTFRTACSPPVYATLPATEGFESTWLSRCDTREVPSASWLNTPTTGNNSWRREDDGASANWTSPTLGSFSPSGSQGSAHAARFHSYYTTAGVTGALDFYVDLSAAGTKRLTFDYVNVSTDGSKLDVLLSTDGGVTFTTTPLLSVATSASFSTRTLDLTATSATSVIRFRGTGDFGSYDIGLDNVQVRLLPNVDLAATALVSPTATQGCYSSAETVTVTVSNVGAQALDFSVNPATVTATVTTPTGPQTLTGSITTGTLAVGATQNVTLSSTLNMAAAGTYTFAIAATVTGDGNTANDALTPAPTRTVVAPVAGTLSPASSTICVSGTAALSLAGAANGSIQYQSSPDNVTFTDISGATSAAYTTPVLTSTTYYRAQVRCGSNVATSNVSTITVTNPVVASTNGPVAICAGNTATLTATAGTGSQVRFFSAATGGTALTTTTPGSYTTPALTASTTYYAEAYTSSSSVAGLADNSASNGTFAQATLTDYPLGFAVSQAGTLASVDVYPSAAGALTIRLYSTAGTQPGGTTTAVAGSDVTITVTAAQVGTRVTVPLNYALAAGEYRISNSSGTLGRFTTYSGTYPLTSGPLTVRGSYNAATSTSFSNTTYNSFFNLTFNSECAGATRTAIPVNVTQPATASFGTNTGSSCGTSAYTLTGAVGGSATGGTYTSSGTGTFSPNASTLTATYTPSAADVAAGTVTITLTSTGSTPCPAATATFALSISPAPVAGFSYPTATTYCAGSTSTVSPTLATGATAGTFSSTAGLTIDATTGVITLATSTAGTYTVTNTVAASGACAAVSATTTVTITPATSAAFAYAGSTFCVTGTNPTPTVTGTAGGTFSSTSGLTINATTGAINLSASTPGTYTVTYNVSGACGSSATASVSITAAPLASFSYPTTTTYCAGSTSTISPTLGTGATAGTFSSTTGLSINATTGVITLSTSTAGTYTITNTIAAANGCATATATATVTITPATSATFSYGGGTFCVTGANPTATVTGTAGGTFSGTSGLTINAATGAITLSSTAPGTYTVTYTVAGACGSSSTQSVTITTAPVATFSYGTPPSYCVSGTTNPAPSFGAGASGGAFSSTTGLTINASTGVITLSSSTPGTYTVTNTITASGGCAAATATTTVTITAAPLASFSYGTTSSYCVSGTTAPAVVLGTGATAGTFSSTTGLTINATTGAITLASSTPGTYTVTNTVAAANGCAATTATAQVTITAAPVATFSYPAATTYCAGSTSTVSPTLGTGATAGTFSSTTGLTINAITGVITLSTSTAGTYTVTNTIAAANGCATATATATVTITPATSATFAYSGTTFCATGTNPTPNVTGTAGGTFSSTTGLSINATTGAITLSSSTPGTYTVTYTVAGACGSSATATVTITSGPVAAFSYGTGTPTFCVSGTTNPTVTLGTGATAGTFTSTTGLTINATTGAITLSSSTPGTYTVTNTVAASGGCAATTATASVTITAAPVATFSYGTSSTFCVSGTTAPAVVLGTGATAGTFTSTTGLSITATTGAINLSASTPGTYTVTNTVAASGGCAATTATTSVTITAAPAATFSYATSAGCVGSTAAVTPTLGTGASAGTFSSTTGLTINATTGAITLSSSTAGTYTVTNTVAAAGGCAAATATTTFTVNPRPATPTISVAYNGPTTTLTSSATTGNQWYLGINPVTGATGQTLVLTGLPSQLGSYTVTTTNANGCVSLPSAPLVVTSAKNSIAGSSLRVYPNPTPTGQVTLELSGFRAVTQLSVLDALGRVIASEVLPANNGTTTHALDLSGVATGVYLLRLSNADGVETRRLVRE